MPITIEDVMEIACALCHYPYKCKNQDTLDEICEACPLEGVIKRYKEGRSFDPES